MLNAIQQGIITTSTKTRLEELEAQKSDLEVSILQAQLQRPRYTTELIVNWINQFKYGDVNSREYQRRIIDTFVNSTYVFDDRLVFTYNFNGGKGNQIHAFAMLDEKNTVHYYLANQGG